MATPIGLNMKITADTAGIATGVAQVDRLMGKLADSAIRLDSVFGTRLSGALTAVTDRVQSLGVGLPTAAAGLVAFGAGATFVAAKLLALEDRVEKLGNTAAQLGVSFEFVQVLENAAARSGSSIEAVAGGIARLQNSLLGVDEESKKAQAALANLGLTADEIRGLAPEKQYELLAQRITAIEDPARRTATAIALFGKSGKDLLPFFGNIEKARNDIQRLGGSISSIDRARIDQFGDGVDALSTATGRLFDVITTTFAGFGEGLTKGLGDAIGGLAASLKPALDALTPFLDGLGVAVQVIGQLINVGGNLIAAVLTPLGNAGVEAAAKINYLATAFENAVENAQVFAAEIAQSMAQVTPATQLAAGAFQLLQASSSASLQKVVEDSDAARAATEKMRDAMAQKNIAFNDEQVGFFDDVMKQQEQRSSDELDALLNQEKGKRNVQQQIDDAAVQAARTQLDELLNRAAAENNIRDQIETRDREIADARKQLADAEGNFFRENNRRGNEPLRVQDIRSGGIDEVLRLAAGREDPAIEESRRQTAELQRLRQEIIKLGGTVELI